MKLLKSSPGRPPRNGIDNKVKTGFSLDPDVAQSLSQEKNKSALINKLLRKYYSIPESSRRLVYSLQLINEDRVESKRLSIAKVAHMLGLERVGILQNYFEGEEPSFKFLDDYAHTFGIYPNWLKFGDASPFYSSENTCLFATGYLSRIKELSPKVIYFLREDNNFGNSGILLKFSENKFIYFPKTWDISSNGGSTKQRQIFMFYQFIKTLKLEGSFNYLCQGQILEKDKFSALFCGRVFPGSVIGGQDNYWWNDFTDIYCSQEKAQEYEQVYGKEFIKAQEIAKSIADSLQVEPRACHQLGKLELAIHQIS
jgi:hypothetical protein